MHMDGNDDALSIDLADDPIDRILGRLVISVKQAVRITIQTLCCELLLLTCWYKLRDPELVLLLSCISRGHLITHLHV